MHLKNKTLSVFGILLFSVAVFMIAGCASQRDFINLKTELDALKVSNDKLEKNLGTIGNDKAQALKNQATIQAQFSDLQTQIREIQGKIEELSAAPNMEARIKVLEDSMKGQIAATSTKSQYDAAMEKFRAGKNLEALKAFDAYIANNPNGDLIDNANFWAGECLFAEGNFESAMDRYDVVIKNHPKSPKVPDCIYKEGLALIELGDAEAGHLSLKKVINEYPDSEAAKKAKVKMGEKVPPKQAPAKIKKKK